MELCESLHGVGGLQCTMSYSCIVLIMQLMGILMFKLLICLGPESWFTGNNFPYQNLEVIGKDILQFVPFLVATIEIAYQFTHGLTQLKSILKMVHQAIKCLLVICDHAHIKFYFITGPLSSKVFDQLNGLSFSQVLVLNMNVDIFQP